MNNNHRPDRRRRRVRFIDWQTIERDNQIAVLCHVSDGKKHADGTLHLDTLGGYVNAPPHLDDPTRALIITELRRITEQELDDWEHGR